MKKFFITLLIIVVCGLTYPANLLAAQNDNEKNADENDQSEYNDLGIKKGTEVYGEDISELTEEELQYVPEGWRDGKVESEHPTEQKSIINTYGVYPDVNKYIESKKLTTPKLERNHINHLPKFNYRKGNGKPEGVVAHETANSSSTITGEISFMSRNYKNAFVHAFVDGSRVIEVHPTDYGAWGAGRYANERFIHVELVRSHSFDEFARSINNYSEYLAELLYTYNLGVDSAESDGKGTLWSHKAVSNHLGGTTHVDPHGYFAQWGYHWNDFVKLVKKKYDALDVDKISKTSKLGHLRSAHAKIYKEAGNELTAKAAGDKYTHSVYYIKKQAKINNQLYYLISNQPSSKNGIIGWVNSKDLNTRTHVGHDKKKKTFYIKGTGKAYDKAWGGKKNLVYNLSDYKNKEFQVHLTEKVGKNTWYRGKLNGKTVWMHSSYVTTKEEKKTSKLGHIRSASKKIYQEVGNESTAKAAGSKYTDSVYYIKKQAKINDQIYYLISNEPSSKKGTIGWMKSQDLSTHKHVGKDKKKKTFYIKGTGKAYDKAWGGKKNLVYNLSDYKNRKFQVHLTEKVGKNTWYRGKLNGKTVWMHSSYVTTKEEKKTSKLGHIRSASKKIYQEIGNESTAKAAGSKYTNSVYYIKKQAKINDQVYYLISYEPSSKKGTVGWVKSQDLSTHTHKGYDKKKKTFHVKGTGKAYDTAWGGKKNVVYNLADYKGQVFHVHLTEKVGKNIWYRGKLDGKTVWMHSAYIKK